MTQLAQLSDVKDFLQIDQTDTSADRFLNRLLNACSAFVESQCRRKFLVQEYTDYLNGTEHRKLILKKFPVVTVESITLDGDNTITPDRVDNDTAMLIRKEGWHAQDEIEVVYTAGYAQVPDDIVDAVIDLVAWKYSQSLEESTGKTKQQQGGVTFEYSQAQIPPHIAAILTRYTVIDV